MQRTTNKPQKKVSQLTPRELAELEEHFRDWVDSRSAPGSFEAAREYLCEQHFAEPQQMEIQIWSAELDDQSKEWILKGVFENQKQFIGSPADLGLTPPAVTTRSKP